MKKIKCNYCGAEKKDPIFVIGASPKPEWTMIWGTGKITCPDCYDVAAKEGRKSLDKFDRIITL